ncbi:MAG TPA: hypothetical protein DEV81_21685 [Cyanobacteria bacterium UBA11049]|nr:hypothetical protein [Cyanobacteria bacterium UBA11049]
MILLYCCNLSTQIEKFENKKIEFAAMPPIGALSFFSLFLLKVDLKFIYFNQDYQFGSLIIRSFVGIHALLRAVLISTK